MNEAENLRMATKARAAKAWKEAHEATEEVQRASQRASAAWKDWAVAASELRTLEYIESAPGVIRDEGGQRDE